MLTKTKGIEVNAKQIERVCQHYGEEIEKIQAQSIASGAPPVNFKADFQNYYYAMLDGAMLLTREEKWKELKLGCIFSLICTKNKWLQKRHIDALLLHRGFYVKFLFSIPSFVKFILYICGLFIILGMFLYKL